MHESVGDSPSGKASAFGADIRGFESLIPSQEKMTNFVFVFFLGHKLRYNAKTPPDLGRPLGVFDERGGVV